jgi:hypothetical protein
VITQTIAIVVSLCLIRPAQPAVGSDESAVTITGGADATGDGYAWTVVNNHTSPIVYVEFPHYHASLFLAPDGWSTDSTFLVNVGVEDRPGTCTARVGQPASGIKRGATGTFQMRVYQPGTRRGQGTVVVRFADGSEVQVSGVEMPTPEAMSDKYAPLIGLGAIFIIWLAIGAKRRGKIRRTKASEQDPTTPQG